MKAASLFLAALLVTACASETQRTAETPVAAVDQPGLSARAEPPLLAWAGRYPIGANGEPSFFDEPAVKVPLASLMSQYADRLHTYTSQVPIELAEGYLIAKVRKSPDGPGAAIILRASDQHLAVLFYDDDRALTYCATTDFAPVALPKSVKKHVPALANYGSDPSRRVLTGVCSRLLRDPTERPSHPRR